MTLLLLQTLLSAAVLPLVLRAAGSLRCWVRVPRTVPPTLDRAPSVTVLVPARNEERTIERCVRSLLAQQYPRERLRVIGIDDRSADATPAILARLASQDERLTVLQGTPLPAGWQGKCWALHQAAQQVDPDAEYLLFVDADTVHEPWMLGSAIQFAQRHGTDLLSLAPGQEMGTPAERLLLPSIWGIIMNTEGTMADVNDPARPEVAKAIGQFMLFRADAYRALGGHAAVKAEIVEDFALARRAKRLGQRLVLADGRDLLRTRMYHSAAEIWEGYSKNAFDEVQKQPGGALAGLLGLPLVALGPYVCALVALRRIASGKARLRTVLLLGQALAQVLVLLSLGVISARWVGLPWWYGLAQPLSGLFLWGILLNSTWRTLSGRGVVWKGRTY